MKELQENTVYFVTKPASILCYREFCANWIHSEGEQTMGTRAKVTKLAFVALLTTLLASAAASADR
ncbi:MAG: hypothetical protein OEV00_16110, partial [Acidobacteriota bacterium]|nr:hypothetical protein [Acidobacteriota bacterium]